MPFRKTVLRRILTMNENQSNHSPAAAPADQNKGQMETSSRDERLELIRAFQTQAMQRADALAANLAVINGDLMQFAYRLRQSMDQSLTGSEADYSQWARQAELYLRCVRQVDRLAQIDRQRGQSAEPEKNPY
jgi:hypothetical protein